MVAEVSRQPDTRNFYSIARTAELRALEAISRHMSRCYMRPGISRSTRYFQPLDLCASDFSQQLWEAVPGQNPIEPTCKPLTIGQDNNYAGVAAVQSWNNRGVGLSSPTIEVIETHSGSDLVCINRCQYRADCY